MSHIRIWMIARAKKYLREACAEFFFFFLGEARAELVQQLSHQMVLSVYYNYLNLCLSWRGIISMNIYLVFIALKKNIYNATLFKINLH